MHLRSAMPYTCISISYAMFYVQYLVRLIAIARIPRSRPISRLFYCNIY